ncbi:MAG: sugar phosphate isomerase/epimerase family protein [Lachnospiraceae bacterium]
MENNIKLGAVAWGLPGGGLFAPEIAKRAGLDGIQLELGYYHTGYALSQQEVIDCYLESGERLGIEYPAIVLNDLMEHEFINGRNTEHGAIAYDQIALGIDVAARMKVNAVMIPNFIKNLITTPEHLNHTRDALTFACRLGKQQGVSILTENALDWKQQHKLLRDIGDTSLLIHFDTQNFKFNFDMDQCEQLENLFPYMADQMHVKDGINEPGECLLGQGNTDFAEQMKILKRFHYAGWIMIENYYNLSLRKESPDNHQIDLLLRDIETIKKSFG